MCIQIDMLYDLGLLVLQIGHYDTYVYLDTVQFIAAMMTNRMNFVTLARVALRSIPK